MDGNFKHLKEVAAAAGCRQSLFADGFSPARSRKSAEIETGGAFSVRWRKTLFASMRLKLTRLRSGREQMIRDEDLPELENYRRLERSLRSKRSPITSGL